MSKLKSAAVESAFIDGYLLGRSAKREDETPESRAEDAVISWLRSDYGKAADAIAANLARLDQLVPGTVVTLSEFVFWTYIEEEPGEGMYFLGDIPGIVMLDEGSANPLLRCAVEMGATVTLPVSAEAAQTALGAQVEGA